MRYIILGTAGHIDHGKSSLVKALTGTDPDRLKEEKVAGWAVPTKITNMGRRNSPRYTIISISCCCRDVDAHFSGI